MLSGRTHLLAKTCEMASFPNGFRPLQDRAKFDQPQDHRTYAIAMKGWFSPMWLVSRPLFSGLQIVGLRHHALRRKGRCLIEAPALAQRNRRHPFARMPQNTNPNLPRKRRETGQPCWSCLGPTVHSTGMEIPPCPIRVCACSSANSNGVLWTACASHSRALCWQSPI